MIAPIIIIVIWNNNKKKAIEKGLWGMAFTRATYCIIFLCHFFIKFFFF
jgi:hypothetical protein